jgi:hypothetical protein
MVANLKKVYLYFVPNGLPDNVLIYCTRALNLPMCEGVETVCDYHYNAANE